MEQLKGYIGRIRFQSEDGYTVADLVVDGEAHTCVGMMRGFSEGESVEVEGEYVVHPKYLEQFKISKIRAVAPEDSLAIMRYLGSGAIKGIGEALAKRIVDYFGDDTFRIIEEEPERLAEVKGISVKKAQEITDQLMDKRQTRNAILFLQQYGIGPNLANKIYLKYGNDLYRVIKENPYQMVEDIQGVGFKIADEIATQAGIHADSDYRIRCGILYVLYQLTAEGHCYYPKNFLLEKTAELLGLETAHIDIQLQSLAMDHRVIMKRMGEEERIYPTSFFREEMLCARKLLELRDSYDYPDATETVLNMEKRLKDVEKSMEKELDDLQRKAVIDCMRNGVFLLSGGPGTGKTTTINAILKFLELECLDFILAAPTGRAAKRITETTGYEARTIHRMLEISASISDDRDTDNRRVGTFERNEENPLEADVVIIDEVSMVDIHLLKALLMAIVPGTKLVLVGDVNQLPSVGPGQILRDIMNSKRFSAVTLKKIFRQANESHIVSYAHKINQGEMIDFSEKYRDFFLLEKDTPEIIYYYMEQLIRDKVPKTFHITPYEVQVLTPMRKGPLGAEGLNRILQERLNPSDPGKREYPYGDVIFREGDKVMQIRNDYNLEWEVIGKYNVTIEQGTGVFNGDIGIVEAVNEYEKMMRVKFDDGRMVRYPFQMLDELEHAFAITIHKSQGSEYPAIIMPILGGPRMLLTRNLLYTGITRAKECVMILGSSVAVRQMIVSDMVHKRYTSLCERIIELDMIEK